MRSRHNEPVTYIDVDHHFKKWIDRKQVTNNIAAINVGNIVCYMAGGGTNKEPSRSKNGTLQRRNPRLTDPRRGFVSDVKHDLTNTSLGQWRERHIN